jgi:hypothetical protein
MNNSDLVKSLIEKSLNKGEVVDFASAKRRKESSKSPQISKVDIKNVDDWSKIKVPPQRHVGGGRSAMQTGTTSISSKYGEKTKAYSYDPEKQSISVEKEPDEDYGKFKHEKEIPTTAAHEKELKEASMSISNKCDEIMEKCKTHLIVGETEESVAKKKGKPDKASGHVFGTSHNDETETLKVDELAEDVKLSVVNDLIEKATGLRKDWRDSSEANLSNQEIERRMHKKDRDYFKNLPQSTQKKYRDPRNQSGEAVEYRYHAKQPGWRSKNEKREMIQATHAHEKKDVYGKPEGEKSLDERTADLSKSLAREWNRSQQKRIEEDAKEYSEAGREYPYKGLAERFNASVPRPGKPAHLKTKEEREQDATKSVRSRTDTKVPAAQRYMAAEDKKISDEENKKLMNLPKHPSYLQGDIKVLPTGHVRVRPTVKSIDERVCDLYKDESENDEQPMHEFVREIAHEISPKYGAKIAKLQDEYMKNKKEPPKAKAEKSLDERICDLLKKNMSSYGEPSYNELEHAMDTRKKRAAESKAKKRIQAYGYKSIFWKTGDGIIKGGRILPLGPGGQVQDLAKDDEEDDQGAE